MVLCEMTRRPPYTVMNFCTTPLPLPYSKVDFEDKRVRKHITDSTIRNPIGVSALPNIARTSPRSIKTTCEHPEANNMRQLEAEAMTKTLIPNDSLCLPNIVELSLLMRDAVTTLYSPTNEIKIALYTLNDSVDRWLSRLPAELQFKNLRSGQPFLRQRISLAFQFYSTKLVLSQSYLRLVADEVYKGKPVVAFCGNMASIYVQDSESDSGHSS
ncbi:hypothetical protein N7490_004348 [Penicillium lividum]|nr:hypothetical protein N7490_004348 [Penicillium lividum]